MNEDKKIRILQRVLAASAFVCALSILPVMRYALLDRPLASSSPVAENGQVAGVSTSLPDVAPSPSATPLICVNKEKELADLDKWLADQETYEKQRYTDKTSPFNETLATLKGSEHDALQKIVDGELKNYQDRVQAAEAAVASQKSAVASLPCVVE